MSRPLAQLFLDAAHRTVTFVREPQVAAAWDGESVLPGYTVGGLAAHLVRAVLTVETYLAAPEPDDSALVTAAVYFARALGDHDPRESDFHRAVRERGAEAAAEGPAAVAAELERGLAVVASAGLDPARRVSVLGGLALTLEQYLATRLLELLVHGDDLAASVGLPAPDHPAEAWDVVAALLVDVAVARHGTRTLALGLARPERGPASPLR